jgi:hypothetical protein
MTTENPENRKPEESGQEPKDEIQNVDAETEAKETARVEEAAAEAPVAQDLAFPGFGGKRNDRSSGNGGGNFTPKYPVLTEEVDHGLTTRSGYGSSGTVSGVAVERAFRDVLGWRYRATDYRGFLTALNQSFTAKEEDGKTVWEWTPRSYAVQVESGAITGAQASIYTRAKNALDHSLPLLEGLTTLGTDTDEEQDLALRAIVESEFTELVNEFGYEGGPRVQRVETLFDLLLGEDQGGPNPGGHLKELKHELGLDVAHVNTVVEEQNLTNFLVLVDYVRDTYRSWCGVRDYFKGEKDVFLGTQLVLIGRSLTVIAESVQETYFAMDSVFLGPSERQATELDFGDEGTLLISELLEWADYVATEEGPRLIREGGKVGVISLHTTAARLAGLVRRAQTGERGDQDADTLPEGYGTGRVQRALVELQYHLSELGKLAGKFAKPERDH